MRRRRGHAGRRVRHLRPGHRVGDLRAARAAHDRRLPDLHHPDRDIIRPGDHDLRGPDDDVAGPADHRRRDPDDAPRRAHDVRGRVGLSERVALQVHVQGPVPADTGRSLDRPGFLHPGHPRAVLRRGYAAAAGGRGLDRPGLRELAARGGRRPEQHAPAAAQLLEPHHPDTHAHFRRRVDGPGHGRDLRRPVLVRAAGCGRGQGLPAHRLRAERRGIHLGVGAGQDRDDDRHLLVDQLELRPGGRRRGADRLRADQHPAGRRPDLAEAGRHAGRPRRSRPSRRVCARNVAADAVREAPPQGPVPRGASALPRRGAAPRAPAGRSADRVPDRESAHAVHGPGPAADPGAVPATGAVSTGGRATGGSAHTPRRSARGGDRCDDRSRGDCCDHRSRGGRSRNGRGPRNAQVGPSL